MSVPYPIILFDGECGFCHGAVRFILRREKRPLFHFAGFETAAGRHLCQQEGIDREMIRSLVLIRGRGDVLIRSDATLTIASELRCPWNLLTLLRIIPRGLRDVVYSIISSLRARLVAPPACTLPVQQADLNASRFWSDL